MIDPFVFVMLLLVQVVLQWGVAFLFIVLVKKYIGKSIKKGVGSVGESIKNRVGDIQQSASRESKGQDSESTVE